MMETDKLIVVLLSVSVETGSLVCLGCGHEHGCGIHGCAILREVAARFATLQKRYDELNDFEQSQCAKLLVKLAEKDKQLAAANFIHYIGPDAMEAYRAFNVPQEAGEHHSAPPAWAAQFERRFMAGEGGG